MARHCELCGRRLKSRRKHCSYCKPTGAYIPRRRGVDWKRQEREISGGAREVFTAGERAYGRLDKDLQIVIPMAFVGVLMIFIGYYGRADDRVVGIFAGILFLSLAILILSKRFKRKRRR